MTYVPVMLPNDEVRFKDDTDAAHEVHERWNGTSTGVIDLNTVPTQDLHSTHIQEFLGVSLDQLKVTKGGIKWPGARETETVVDETVRDTAPVNNEELKP